MYYTADELKPKKSGGKSDELVNRMSENPEVEIDKCIGCMRCQRECPTRCIKMVPGPKERKGKPILIPTLHPAEEYKSELKEQVEETLSKCIGCSTCTTVCSPSCLSMKEIPLVDKAFDHIRPAAQAARVVASEK